MSGKVTQEYMEDLIGKLKFISKIEANEKINVSYGTKGKNGIVMAVYRWAFGEKRNGTYDFLSKTINDSIAACYVCLNSKEKLLNQLGHITLSCLETLEPGINNLMKTSYSEDSMFVSKLESLLVSLKQKIIVIKEYQMQHLKNE